MVNLFQRRIDPAASLDGVWVPYEDGQLRIAKWDNRNYQRLLQEIAVQARAKASVDADVDLSEYAYELIAKTILKDWKTICFAENGQETAYTVELGLAALTEVPEFCEFVIRESKTQAHYLRKVEDAQLKNS